MTQKLTLAKAAPTGDQVVLDTLIEITGEVPEALHLGDYRSYYMQAGQELCDALTTSLPGGTVDALLVALLDYKRSLFRVTL